MRNFLVTGGAGFIGSNLVKKLISDSHSVTIFEKIEKNKAYRLESIFDKIEYETIDIKNLELIKQKISHTASICQDNKKQITTFSAVLLFHQF